MNQAALEILQERPKLGELLLKHTSLTEEQLEQALEIQAEEGGLLGEIMLKRNMILPHEIMKALCVQLALPFVEDLNPDQIDLELVSEIPIHYAKTKEIIPIEKREINGSEYLIVVVSNPFHETVVDDLQVLTGLPIEIAVSTSNRIQEAINRVYEKRTSDLVDEIGDEFEETMDLEGPIDILEATENDAPVIKFVNSLLFRAVKERASDIHIEPFEKEFLVRFRTDGVLKDIIRQPKRAHAAISSRIKVMGKLDIAEKRLPQDGRIQFKMAGKEIDIRLSTVPTIHGERVVMRLLEQNVVVLELEALGFSEESRRKIQNLIHRKHGIILVTGPTGHGKSTTLSACLSTLNSPERNILTVEDPIEYQLKGVNQVQVNEKINLTFARALRSFLRQNPDVIMVGEIRDKETAEIAINASLTGHLVLSTLHTNDAAGATTRLNDMGVEPFLVASSLLGVVAQRLIRKVCKECRELYQPTEADLAELGIKVVPKNATVYRPKGCPSCSQTGYSGRTVIHELLVMDDEVRNLIIKNSDSGLIHKKAIEKGMISLRADGIQKVISGITTIEELVRATHSDT
jgi:general secretion pathway protein E